MDNAMPLLKFFNFYMAHFNYEVNIGTWINERARIQSTSFMVSLQDVGLYLVTLYDQFPFCEEFSEGYFLKEPIISYIRKTSRSFR